MTTPTPKPKRASVIALKNIVHHHQYAYFIWKSDDARCQPILIDAFSASRMVSAYDALSPHLKAKFSRMVAASRNQFMHIFNVAMSL